MLKNHETKGRVKGDEAAPDEIGKDPRQVGPDSAGQSGDPQRLSNIADANEESVAELADTDQAFEAAAVDGVEDAAEHPERPVHTHNEYGRPDNLPSARSRDRKKAS
jgi:N utilization substance protein A